MLYSEVRTKLRKYRIPSRIASIEGEEALQGLPRGAFFLSMIENKIYLIIGGVSAFIGALGTHLYYKSEIADYLLLKEQEYSQQLELKIEENKKLQAVVNEIEWELIEQKDSYEKNLADLRSRYTIDGLFDCSRNGECVSRTDGSASEFVCYRTTDLRKRINQSVAIGKRADDLAMKYNALLKVCNGR